MTEAIGVLECLCCAEELAIGPVQRLPALRRCTRCGQASVVGYLLPEPARDYGYVAGEDSEESDHEPTVAGEDRQSLAPGIVRLLERRPWVSAATIAQVLKTTESRVHSVLGALLRDGRVVRERWDSRGPYRYALPGTARPGRVCADCGAPSGRAERCRRCYRRHRYWSDPAYRARQLAMQAAWRQQQRVARRLAEAAGGT